MYEAVGVLFYIYVSFRRNFHCIDPGGYVFGAQRKQRTDLEP